MEPTSKAASPVIVSAVDRIEAGIHLSRSDAEAVMEDLLSGRCEDAQIARLLTSLRAKGETLDELIGFAAVMRRHARPIFANSTAPLADALVDTCGTGGDARGTFNISTGAAFVAAGAGARVAKHGNRSISSRCGSADVLEALGVCLDVPVERMGEAIQQIGIGFLFAPTVHTAMKHAAAARRQVGGRTIFNLLGPLTNPAGATAQVLGVFDARVSEMMARALEALGCKRAFVVHGVDGLDEISLSGETFVTELRDGTVRSYTVVPEDFRLRRTPLEALAGGGPAENARIIRSILNGEHGPPREVVLANAAAALVAAGCATDWLDGVRLSAKSIDSGAALRKLDALTEFTNAQSFVS